MLLNFPSRHLVGVLDAILYREKAYFETRQKLTKNGY